MKKKKEIYVSLCLENMLTNIESNTKSSNKNNTLANIRRRYVSTILSRHFLEK